MAERQQVSVHFGDQRDVRYIEEPPQVGDYVKHGDELWLVSAVGVDEGGSFVICERPLTIRPAPGTTEDDRTTTREPPPGPAH